MKKNKKIAGGAIAAVAITAIAIVAWPGQDTPIEFEYTTLQNDTLRSTVTATGTIEPVTKVEVGTQVSGIIDRIYVDYNSVVKKGQVIAELDRTNLASELNSMRANLASAKSELDYQQANYRRYEALNNQGLVSRNDYESAYLQYKKALESYNTARESVKKAETNIGYATITSPIDGVVLSKAVEEGQTVASSFNTPTLFTIAQDLTDMRVIADIDEADIGAVAEGQPVTFSVDAFPNDVFHGEVTQIRQEATTTNNVVTYEVVISAPNNELKLKPGLTANVTIQTLQRTDVLSVKSKALRFSPATEVLKGKYRVEDTNAKNKLWTLEGNRIKAHAVTIGLSDGARTEITGGLAQGTRVILSMSELTASQEEEQQPESSPFMPPRPGQNRNKK